MRRGGRSQPDRRSFSGLMSQRGQALVELAIVTPLLLLLLCGAVDGGRILFTYIALQDAVHEGALFYSYEPTASLAAVEARVRSSSNHHEVVNANVSKSPCSATTLSVTATYSLPILTPIAAQIFGGTVQMGATFTGTNLGGRCS